MSKTKNIADTIKELKGQMKPAFDSLKKEEVVKKERRGGKRAGSGRKTQEVTLVARGVHQIIEDHVNEEVDVQVFDKVTGKMITIKRPRIAIVMRRLFDMSEKSHEAGGKWMDRAAGRPMQPIEHRGDKDKPLRLIVDI